MSASTDISGQTNRYQAAFDAARERGETLFMPYLTAGFPTPDETAPLLRALVRGGAGALEVGVPFSDPLADGPTIQRASTVALQQGVRLRAILDEIATLRADGIEVPVTLMGYLNPFISYQSDGASEERGFEALARDAAAAGVDGCIIVDLPPEESDPYRDVLQAHGLALIYLLAPTSTAERIRAVADRAAGFVYLVSVTGVTGVRSALPSDLVDFVRRVRAGTDLPLAVGFGISDRAQVESVGELCEAAVTGSAVIRCVEEAPPADRVAVLQQFAEVMTGRRRGDQER
jgi:tryptophan synthase alpha subunit